MSNDNYIIVVTTIVFLTLVTICSGLRKKKSEVDQVIKKGEQDSEKEIPTQDNNLTFSSPDDSKHPQLSDSAESSYVEPDSFVDLSVLQNYSSDLGYWISQFEFAIDYIAIPLYISVIGHTFINKIYPGELANFKYYTFFSTIPSLPINV